MKTYLFITFITLSTSVGVAQNNNQLMGPAAKNHAYWLNGPSEDKLIPRAITLGPKAKNLMPWNENAHLVSVNLNETKARVDLIGPAAKNKPYWR